MKTTCNYCGVTSHVQTGGSICHICHSGTMRAVVSEKASTPKIIDVAVQATIDVSCSLVWLSLIVFVVNGLARL